MAKPKGSGAKGSARGWSAASLPLVPEPVKIDVARQKLNDGFSVRTESGSNVIFDKSVLNHWEIEEGYDSRQVNGRLSKLNMAISAVKAPREVWVQRNQRAFVQGFRKPTGGRIGVVVFVNNKTKKAITYFPKDIGALDKVRKGIQVK